MDSRLADFDSHLRFSALGDSAITETHQTIRSWIESAPFQKAIAAFGWADDASLLLADRVDRLVSLSDEWDFRKRTAQVEVTAAHSESTRWTSQHSLLAPEQAAIATSAGNELGLASASHPQLASYDAVLVLGGARLSCLLRTEWAASVVSSGVRAGEFVLLASERPVGASERDATDTYAPSADTEFDLFVSAASKVFGVDAQSFEGQREEASNPNLSWEIREYPVADLPRVIVMSAPSSDPQHRRSNSADTYKFYIDRYHLSVGAKLLLVTSPIYVPYQQLEAIRVLTVPMGVRVETIGFPPEWHAELQGMQGPQHYLQEMRSFLQSSQRFLAAYPA